MLLIPSVKQSSGCSSSSASSGIFLRISSGSGQSTVLPSEELVSSSPCGAEAQGSEGGSLRNLGHRSLARLAQALLSTALAWDSAAKAGAWMLPVEPCGLAGP